MYHPQFPNLLAAGRIVSAEDDGWEITRVIPTAALTGQACGIYAMEMVKSKIAAAAADVRKIQTALTEDGVQLHFEKALSK